MKIFQLKKVDFIIKVVKIDFYRSQNKIRSAHLKSALKFEFNYIPHNKWF
jgi:hypothetical protein